MAKKKAKSILKNIGDAMTAGAEAVIDAGAKAVHAVGDLIPTGKTPPKKAAKPSSKSAKAKAPKTAAKTAKPKAPAAKAATAKPKAAKSAKKAKAVVPTKKKAGKKA